MRRLRKCEKTAGIGSRRYKVIARTLRGSPGKHGGLYIDATGSLQLPADDARDASSKLEVFRHLRATQVKIPVTQAHILTRVGVFVELERRRRGRIEYRECLSQNLDLARLHLRIDGAFLTRPHASDDAQDIFASHAIGEREALFGIRVEDNLHDPFTIAHVQKDHAAMIAAALHPAAEFNGFADERCSDVAAVVRAHSGPLAWSRSCSNRNSAGGGQISTCGGGK